MIVIFKIWCIKVICQTVSLDNTNLPNVPDHDDDEEIDIDNFINELSVAVGTSTRRLVSNIVHIVMWHTKYLNAIHVVKIGVHLWVPPEEYFLCKNIIDSSSTCPFDSQ